MTRRGLFSSLFAAPLALPLGGQPKRISSPGEPARAGFVRIESDGTPGGTRIVDDRGRDITSSFHALEVTCDSKSLMKAKLTTFAELQVMAERTADAGITLDVKLSDDLQRLSQAGRYRSSRLSRPPA